MLSEDKYRLLEQALGPVSRETVTDLLALEALALRWSASINLVSPATIPEFWTRHICDSAQLFPLAAAADRWLDVGSGGGFPGLVIGVLLKHRGGTIDLVESNRKKVAFLQHASATLALPVHVHAMRIEDAAAVIRQPDVITARALASLDRLLTLTLPWMENGARALFHKGRDYAREVEESRRRWKFDLIEHPSMTEAGSAVLDIRDVQMVEKH